MDRAQEQQLYRMQAELCQTLADPTRLELLSLLGDGPKAVKADWLTNFRQLKNH